MWFRKITKYFDLASELREVQLEDTGTPSTVVSSAHWFPQYISLVAGILAEQWVVPMIKPTSSPLAFNPHWLVISFVAAIVAFPGAYKASLDPEKPWFYHFAIIFVVGMGWRTLFP